MKKLKYFILVFALATALISVNNVVAGNANVNAPIFDLTGRRVVKAVKGGLYIQNGKKVIVK